MRLNKRDFRVQDVLQEMIFKLTVGQGRLTLVRGVLEGKACAAYAFEAVRNEANGYWADLMKQQNQEVAIDADNEAGGAGFEPADKAPSPEAILLNRFSAEDNKVSSSLLRKAWAKLSERDQIVYWLYVIDDLRAKEVVERVPGISPNVSLTCSRIQQRIRLMAKELERPQNAGE